MRRPLLTGIGFAAVLIVAACSTDEPSQVPLAPTVPTLANSPQCANKLANDIEKQQEVLFSSNPSALADLQGQFDVIQGLCPNAVPEMMNYLQSVITYGAPTTNGNTAQLLVNHWSALVLYVKNETKTWSPDVVKGDGALGGTLDGGAKLLGAGGSMTTFDGRAALQLAATIPAGGPFLFTFQPVAGSLCDSGTALTVSGHCYDVSDYPDGGTYNPAATISLCVHQPTVGSAGIGHAKTGFGTEVLPEVASSLSCAHDPSTAMNSWLGRSAGPLGRAVAMAFDYLRPRALFADDAGESGSIGSFSLVGGIHNDIIRDDFEELNATGLVGPDVGDLWTIQASSPGYIVINQAGYADLPGPVVELSQAQGNCQNCPVFKLLATRENSAQGETIGTYDINWQSRQNKPSVKEAPFVILNAGNSNNNANEIARLAYTTVSSQNRLIFTVRGSGSTPDLVVDAGPWVKETAQSFKVTLNLDVLNNTQDKTISLWVNGVAVAGAQGVPAPRALSLMQVGYHLTGIDAGIIASDNWIVTRRPDVP